MGRAILPIESPELVETMALTLKAFPRVYLFSDLDTGLEPMPLALYNKCIGKYWAPDRVVDYKIIRSAYVTWFYEHNKGLVAKRELATSMRHHQKVAEMFYYKYDGAEHFNKSKNKTAKAEYNKLYYEKHRDMLKAKNRVYWTLNNFSINKGRVLKRSNP